MGFIFFCFHLFLLPVLLPLIPPHPPSLPAFCISKKFDTWINKTISISKICFNQFKSEHITLTIKIKQNTQKKHHILTSCSVYWNLHIFLDVDLIWYKFVCVHVVFNSSPWCNSFFPHVVFQQSFINTKTLFHLSLTIVQHK